MEGLYGLRTIWERLMPGVLAYVICNEIRSHISLRLDTAAAGGPCREVRRDAEGMVCVLRFGKREGRFSGRRLAPQIGKPSQTSLLALNRDRNFLNIRAAKGPRMDRAMGIPRTSLNVLLLIATMVAGLSGCATLPLDGLFRPGPPLSATSRADSTETAGASNSGEKRDSDASPSGTVSSNATSEEARADGPRGRNDYNLERQGNSATADSSQNEADGRAADVTIHSLIAELESSQPLEPETKQRLIEDLQRTPPHLWPAVVQLFRATLAYRRTETSPGKDAGQQSHQDGRVEAAVVQAAWQYSPATESPPPGGLETGPGRASSDSRPQSFARTEQTLGNAVPSVAILPPPPNGMTGRPTSATMPSSTPAYGGPNSGMPPESSLLPPSTQSPGLVEVGLSAASVRPGFPDVESTASAAVAAPAERDWRYLLNSARWQLESRIKTASGGSNQEEELRLRLINLALADREEAVRPVAGLPPNMQDFWSKTFFGLSLMITDPPAGGVETGAASALEAQRYLQDAMQRLRETCPLEIRNPTFVTAVQSWGVYDPFEKNEFSPGRQVLLYAEIENLKSESTAKGYRTSWQSAYRILDESGRVVADYQYPPNEEYCRRVRRDFFIGCELSIPPQLAPGRYTLRLSVTDLLSRRTGETSIEFSVPERPRK